MTRNFPFRSKYLVIFAITQVVRGAVDRQWSQLPYHLIGYKLTEPKTGLKERSHSR